MAVRGARMILWIALQFLAVLSCSLHSVFPASFYSAVHNCTSMCFFYSFDSKVLCFVVLKVCEYVSSESPGLPHFMSFSVSMNHCSPSLLDLFCPRKPLYLSESLYNTALCLDHLSASAFTLQLPATASTALWYCCAIWRERWGQ